MTVNLKREDLNKIIMIGDRVLVKPKSNQQKTTTGLYLPPTIEKKEKLHSGYVIKVGPGYPIPVVSEPDEPWKDKGEDVKFVPIQPQVGDLAVYLHSSAYEITFNDETFLIVPNSAILMLIRDEDLLQ